LKVRADGGHLSLVESKGFAGMRELIAKLPDQIDVVTGNWPDTA
jgi:hypothetical protein